jgi:lipopolysaccharide transport system ATP-binding protein
MDVIEFDGVSKMYSHHGGAQLLRHYLGKRFANKGRQVFYALKNVSLRVPQGHSVAIVGRNGAGKSTLLSLVAGLCPPTEGRVSVRGRVTALLELGSGFHPDLTGAENLMLNASLLGLTREQSRAAFNEIVAFSEIGEFIREPLRTYSPGMVMRLAFAVAVNVDPDILIIDEVIAVGDQAFQAKCVQKIFDFRARGKTLLLVSHGAELVRQLCDQAIWLDRGEILLQGRADEVLAAYAGQAASARV